MKKIFLLMILCIPALLTGCETESMPGNPYNGDDYIFFDMDVTPSETPGEGGTTGLGLIVTWKTPNTFPADFTTSNIDVATFGGIYDYDREYAIKWVTDGDLEAPPATLVQFGDLVIPKNKDKGAFHVIFIKDLEELYAHRGRYFEGFIQVDENKYFKVWNPNERLLQYKIGLEIAEDFSIY